MKGAHWDENNTIHFTERREQVLHKYNGKRTELFGSFIYLEVSSFVCLLSKINLLVYSSFF